MDPWADIEAMMGVVNVEDITPEAIRAYLDIPGGGIKDVKTLAPDFFLSHQGTMSCVQLERVNYLV